jgi:hypothetical protein
MLIKIGKKEKIGEFQRYCIEKNYFPLGPMAI